jgi:hypothetical protein
LIARSANAYSRLQAVEASVTEIKQILEDVQATLLASHKQVLVNGHRQHRLATALSTDSLSDDAELEDICVPADAGISSAPAAINRAVTTQLAGARRRVLEHTNLDLVEIGLLDEPSADQLIRLYGLLPTMVCFPGVVLTLSQVLPSSRPGSAASQSQCVGTEQGASEGVTFSPRR